MPETITQEYLLSLVKDVEFIIPPNSRMTICVLTHNNGYKVNGHEYMTLDSETAKARAKNKALEKLEEFELFLKKQQVYEASIA